MVHFSPLLLLNGRKRKLRMFAIVNANVNSVNDFFKQVRVIRKTKE